MPRDISREHANLAVRDLACRASVLPRNAARGLPCFKKPVSSMTRTPSLSESVSSAYSRTVSRKAFASQRPQPRMACCRQGPGSPAASARIQPVLRRSLPRRPSRKNPAEAATRSWVNSALIRLFTSRSEDAQSSSVASIDAPAICALQILQAHRFRVAKQMQL